jgi:PAS domain S-box-containing protein
MTVVIRVLYVDDEPALLDLCKMFLEDSGEFSVETIESATAALVLLKKEPFDAIVSDYLMPGMDGIRFLAEVRAHVGKIPFILFTGKGREEIVIEAIENGADFYLQKGGDPEAQFAELVQKIRAAVEQRTSENAFKESENRYRSLVDTMHDCVAVYRAVADGEDFVFVDFNHAAEITENMTRQEVVGRRVTEVFPGAQEFGILDVFRRVWRTGTPESFPMSFYKDNRISGWRDNFVYKLPSGEIVAGYRDETVKMQAEAALRESEVRFRTMTDWTSDWEYWISPNGEFIYISPSVERITGYTPGEFTADPELIQRIVHKDDRARFEEHRSLHGVAEQKDQSQEITFRIIHKNGSPRWIGHTCRAIFNADGTWTGRRISNQDITERKVAEEQLRIKDYVFESSLAGNSIADNQGVLTGVNPAFLHMWGYRTKEEVIGKSIGSFFADEQDAVRVLEALGTFGRWEGEITAQRAGGSTFIASSVATVIRDEAGKQIGYQSSVLDITDRKAAEVALLSSLHDKELLLKEIHHRVKNNLQTIASLLYLQSLSTDDEAIKKLLNEARSRVYAMGLIHQKLYQSADITRIPFTDYISQLIEYLKESYGVDETKIRVSVSVKPEDLFFDLDTGIPCGLIINELVMNALKYAFRDRPGGTITIRMERDETDQNVLVVSDDGHGISEDVDLTTMKSLGMTIVASLVRQLGGTMEMVRQPGTTITIRFPTQAPLPSHQPASHEKPGADNEPGIDEKIKRIRAHHG